MLQTYHNIKNVDDCRLQQHDINSVYNSYLVNDMKLNLGKSTIISFARKTNIIYVNSVGYLNYVTI
jgi:hypothetical protein